MSDERKITLKPGVTPEKAIQQIQTRLEIGDYLMERHRQEDERLSKVSRSSQEKLDSLREWENRIIRPLEEHWSTDNLSLLNNLFDGFSIVTKYQRRSLRVSNVFEDLQDKIAILKDIVGYFEDLPDQQKKAGVGNIFVSYRRDDSKTITGRIYDHLEAAFGQSRIFKDVDNIPLGEDFRSVIVDAISSSKILLVVIGQNWLGISKNGKRRLDHPDDFVRIEIEVGLERGQKLQVIPILVDNARMPSEKELPSTIGELAFKNAAVIRDDPDFRRDTERLIKELSRLLNG